MSSADDCCLTQDKIEGIYAHINANICSDVHPDRPCRFWKKSFGAVPDAVARVPINQDILAADFLVWPEPEPGQSILSTCNAAGIVGGR